MTTDRKTDREITFLDGVAPRELKDYFPVGPHTVKIFVFSLSTNSHPKDVFSCQ
jgi:hypothetical protein